MAPPASIVHGTSCWLLVSFILAHRISHSTCGKVQVSILKQETSLCSFPTRLDVTVIRPENSDVTFTLRANQIATLPNHVVLMGANENTGKMEYERFLMPTGGKAYHSPEVGGAFVAECILHQASGERFLTVNGTYYHEAVKYHLYPTLDDVTPGPIDVTASYAIAAVKEYDGTHDHDYIERLSARAPSPPTGREEGGERLPQSRRRRNTVETFYVDLLPVVDYSLYYRWVLENNNNATVAVAGLKTYLGNVLTSMSLRLSTLSLAGGRKVELRMVTPHISTSVATSNFSEFHKEAMDGGLYRLNVETALNAFKDWLAEDSAGLPPNDHAMLFTGYEVYGGLDGEVGSNLTRGLAYVGTICQGNGFSSSVVQDQTAYQSEPVAVHELGHSLGSLHDGQNNTCDSQARYVMANSSYPRDDTNALNPFRFSTCSSQAIDDKITELENSNSIPAECLAPRVSQTLPVVAPLSAKDQCQALFGPASFVCRGSGVPPLEEVCISLFCSIPGTGYCRELAAATGTCCGNGKYCIEGGCVDAPGGTCAMDETCPLEDQIGILSNGKACTDFDSVYCYQEDFHSRCCRSCRTHRTQIQGCEFGDKAPECQEANCGATLTNGMKYNVVCCLTCNNTGCKDVAGINFRGATYTCPSFIAEFGRNYCYFPALHDSNCCHTCEGQVSTNRDCLFGDYHHRYNCSRIPELNRACTDEEETECCETCPTITIPRTTGGPTVPEVTTLGDSNGGNEATTGTGNEPCTGSLCDDAATGVSGSNRCLLAALFSLYCLKWAAPLA